MTTTTSSSSWIGWIAVLGYAAVCGLLWIAR